MSLRFIATITFNLGNHMKLGQVAAALKLRLDNGSPDTEITGVAGIEEAGPGQITFLANPKYAPLAETTGAAAIIVADEFPAGGTALLRGKNPYLAFARALELFYTPPQYGAGVHATAILHPSAQIGEGAHIGPYVVIDQDVAIGRKAVLLAHVVVYRGARIGDNFFAHAHAVVREHCRLGNHVTLQNGVVVGGDGFGFAKDDDGRWQKIVQSGPAVLGDDVEVQANSCIDRASVGETRIGRGAKIDNLVQVGHGSRVGDDTLLCAQVGLAGSTQIGNDCVLAGQVGVAGHCRVGNRVVITAQSGTHGDIPDGSMVSGSPAFAHKTWLRSTAIFSRLPELVKEFRKRS
jgi:UDP-3-O-[3-hydroxymyristoyl] glucosamine N-acyltransferase